MSQDYLKKDTLISRSQYLIKKSKTENLDSRETCNIVKTITPPFQTSGKYQQGDKVYENLRDENSNIKARLPVGSLIKTSNLLSDEIEKELITIQQEKIKLADYHFRNIPEYKNHREVFLKHLNLDDISSIQTLGVKFLNLDQNSKKLFRPFELLKNSFSSSEKIKKSQKNLSRLGRVRVNVVLSNKKIIDQLSRIHPSKKHVNFTKLTGSDDRPISYQGEDGFLDPNSLGLYKTGGNVFYVKRSTALFKTTWNDGVEENLEGSILKFKVDFDSNKNLFYYQARECCFRENTSQGTKKVCHLNKYLFDVENKDINVSSEKWIDLTDPCCQGNLLNSLEVLPQSQYKNFLKVLDLLKSNGEVVNYGDLDSSLLLAKDLAQKSTRFTSSGNKKKEKYSTILDDDLLKIPLHNPRILNIKNKSREILDGPFNTFNYSPHEGKNELNDTWAKPISACAFLQVAKKWQDTKCSKGKNLCRIGFGHVYHPSHLSYFPDRSSTPHESHSSGECFDFRPFTNSPDHAFGPMDHRYQTYNRKLTKEFINLLKESGVKDIVFNDSKIKNTRYVDGHHNHIHACFKQTDPDIKKTCNNGL